MAGEKRLVSGVQERFEEIASESYIIQIRHTAVPAVTNTSTGRSIRSQLILLSASVVEEDIIEPFSSIGSLPQKERSTS